MGKYFDENGNEVEAFGPEEVEEKIDEARSEAIDETAANRQEEIEKMEEEMETLKEELENTKAQFEKETEKEKNFEKLRNIKDDREKQIKELEVKMEETKKNLEEKINELESLSDQKVVEDTILKLSRGNEELKKKIWYEYNRFQGAAANIEERNKRISDAYLLATGQKLDTELAWDVLSSSGGQLPEVKGEELTQEQRELAHKLGISDAELKKRGY